ncbi:MAG: lipopolysaccharide assembly protein LapB [Candidatus Pelagadaptatus aseana]|uniref:lipopolysaccharide assembly protein LapB n=1 Tax=Candidatus Pelagadaptatus aseana TaxID=3120508 RepID=UPI0039B2BD5B
MEWGLLILLVVAVGLGFALGRRSLPKDDESPQSLLAPHYIRGLNYFLNDEQDAAIDTFIHALEVNSETLETHLALGNLLRKRGEVSRAIRVHQNLLARPGLPEERSQQVQLELAKDFVKSGLLDRAEVLLQELVETAPYQIKVQCLKYLIEIYRDEKEWLKGIQAINQLSGKRFSKPPEEWRVVQGQFYCELAEQCLARNDYLVCRRHLKSAMGADKSSVRASLIQADLDMKLGHYKDAAKTLRQIPDQDPAFVPEIVPRLSQCYRMSGRPEALKKALEQMLEQHFHPAIVLELSELVYKEQGRDAALVFISAHIDRAPSLSVAEKMLSLQGQAGDEVSIQMASKAVQSINKTRAKYRCTSCGFGGQQLHWLCPGCKSWSTVKPTR